MEESRTRRAPARLVALLCATLASASLVAGIAPPSASAGGGAPGAERKAAATAVAAAAAFRQRLGLRADPEFVAATFGRAGFDDRRWGIPLDAAESAELGRRAKLQEDAGPALKAWAGDRDAAGAYVDQRAHGGLVLLTTGDPARAKDRLGKLLPAGANARYLRVRYSTAELLALQDRINADLAAGRLAGLPVVSTAIDARANAVAVGVSIDDGRVRGALATRYGDAAEPRLEPPAEGGDACTARDKCPPAKGGIEIVSSYNGNNCTIGFVVRVVGSPDPRILTAGHCVGKSGGTGTSRTWTHNGTSMGWPELTTWTDGADADVALLDPATGAIGGDRNLLYASSSSNLVHITSYRAYASQVQGSLICRSAVASGYHCGTITLTNRSKDVDGHTIDHQWVVDFDACPGDSGGPYFLGNVAYGIHSDSTFGCNPSTNEAWYSPMGWVLSVLAARGHPVSLCTTPSCGSDTNVWTARGSLDASTWHSQLVPLDDGRVLQVGGTSGDLLAAVASSSARIPEVFNPSTGQWSAVANPPWLPGNCDGQFAVRLQDGRVLVGGGRHVGAGAPEACDGAHVFDPGGGSGGSWTTVAAPPSVLESAGAVLLDDGRAFVTGGSGPTGSTSVAMAYSPADDAWAPLAAGPAGALAPLVLPLADGRVLVSGGYVIVDEAGPGYSDVTATSLYDPGTDTWAATAAVGARDAAGLVLADGRVVLAGGQHLTWANGSQGSTFSTDVARFDPGTNTWTQLNPLLTGRSGFALAELSGGVILAPGGRVEGSISAGSPTKAVEALDPASGAWSKAPAMLVSRGGHGATVLDDGRVLVAGGGTTTTETYVPGDVVPPIATTPSTSLRSGVHMTTGSVPIRVTWSASDTGGSGVGTYDVARSTDGGAFTTIATRLLSPSLDTTASRTHTYRYQVRARDWAGNVGPWKPGTTFRMNVSQQTSSAISLSGTWSPASSSSYTGGSLVYATTSGPSATYTFTGRAVGFVTSRGSNRGSFKVYIDGTLVGSVGLYASSSSYAYVAYQKTWSSSGQHTIKIVAVANAGHPRVDVDAFEVISNP